MNKFPPVYSDDESKVLVTIYGNPDVSYDTYSLTQVLRPDLKANDAKYEDAFKETLKAIEGLIVRGLIDGTQLKGGLGMYFHDIKLKYAGKQAAIQERNRVAEFEKNFPKIIAQADAVAAEIAQGTKKDKK